mmetsp:Transcript_19862/g.63119  ORF Transcript_19862/g.63119 Transcript_19862/m.63119 type:complete len:220 (-) Transcript_19862:220-879(-)
MPRVEHVEGATEVDDALAGLGRLTRGELHDAAARGQEPHGGIFIDGLGEGRRAKSAQGSPRVSRRLLVLEMVLTGHEQHAPHQICGGHALGPLDGLEAAQPLGQRISVAPIRRNARVIAVYDVVDVVPVEEQLDEIVGQLVRDVPDDLIHPLARDEGGEPLLLGHQRRSPLVALHLLIADQTHDKYVSQGSRLSQCVAVAEVHHVKASVHVDADRFFPL